MTLERITYGPPAGLNQATLLPDPNLETPPLHDCLQILSEFQGLGQTLSDQPLQDAEVTWYTDGSSFLAEGQCQAGAAVVDRQVIVWAEALPQVHQHRRPN